MEVGGITKNATASIFRAVRELAYGSVPLAGASGIDPYMQTRIALIYLL